MSRSTYSTLSTTVCVSSTGLSPATAVLSITFDCTHCYLVKAGPISLATTFGISVDFFSSSYLDVSVHSVRFNSPMYSVSDTVKTVGFPIRKSADQSLFASSPQLIASYNVLHRL